MLKKYSIFRTDETDRCCRFSSAFSLVELMMVIVVIMILIGISIPVAKYVTGRIIREREYLMDSQMRDALEAYRMAFGEYPITPGNPGCERHYPSEYSPDDGLSTNVLDLTSSPLESFDYLAYEGVPDVDYTLTWPLMIGPELRGEPPYMTFREGTVAYVVTDIGSRTKAYRKLPGMADKVEGQIIYATPINRPLAVAPTTGEQWKYWCEDGENYCLCSGCDDPSCKACNPP